MTAAPSGLVTLLFTDIEGSTRTWEAHPELMVTVLARHDEILRTEIEAAQGYVFKTVGDAFCATFQSAPTALAAAVTIQRALAAEVWPEPISVRVRMSLHSGECEERGGDYFGPVVNRAARLEATAHGGQLVLSGVTAELVRDRLPAGLTLRDMGEHHLKDLGRAERVYQVCGPGLAADFPPLRSLENPGLQHNLPEQVSTFLGRDREVAEVAALVDRTRMVTLAGPGGVGKTRLALQAAAELLDGSGDGVWFVDLAPVDDPSLVAAAVAKVLWVREQGDRPLLDTIVESVRDRRLLVVIDNCEQVIHEAAVVVEALVRRCPGVHVLTTSRETLGIAGEHVYRVEPLGIPGTDDPETVASSEAVGLFVERARQHKADFAIDADNAAVVARLCRRLDGIPFALELAAARMRSMSVRDLDGHLDKRFRLLTGGSRTAVPRQQTLQALIDWSYNLLAPAEQTVLVRLSSFAGGFDLTAAQAVCPGGDIDELDVLDILDSLVAKSLIQAGESGGAARYRMLESIDDYGEARLAERDEAEQVHVRRAHRDHFLALAEEAAPHLIGRRQVEWSDRLDLELDNLRVALHECLSDPDPEPGLRLAVALTKFWWRRGYAVEGVEVLRAHLDRPSAGAGAGAGPAVAAGRSRSAAAAALLLGDVVEPAGASVVRGRALAAAAYLLTEHLTDYAAAEALADEALAVADATGDESLRARALEILALIRYSQGDDQACLDVVDRALPIAQALGEFHRQANLVTLRGGALFGLGENGRPSIEEAVGLFQRADDRRGEAAALANLGLSALLSGELDTARALIGEALRVTREQGDPRGVAYMSNNAGYAALLDGDDGAAADCFREGLATAHRIGARSRVANALLGLACTATRAGDGVRAATLHGAFDGLWFDTLGMKPGSVGEPESWVRDADRARLRELLGDGPFEAAYQTGRHLPIADAMKLAR